MGHTPDTPTPQVCLLLDIDGTLAVTDELYVLAFADLMRPYGYNDVDMKWFSKHVAGKVDEAVFRALLPEGTTEEELVEVSKRKDALFCEKVLEFGAPIVKGLGGALSLAKENGFRCIAVSNAQRGGCEAVLAVIRRELGEDAAVIEDLIVGAECTNAKPSPDPYLEAMRRLGTTPQNCIVFEDSRTGLRAGVAAKVATVVGIQTYLTHDELCAAGATTSMADWTELTAAKCREWVSQC